MLAEDLNIVVAFRGSQHHISVPTNASLRDVRAQLQERTGIAPENQKLLVKGKKLMDDGLLQELGLKDGSKIQMLGTTTQDIVNTKDVETERYRVAQILKEREKKGTPKVRSTASSGSSDHLYRFHIIRPLPHLPNPSGAMSVLQRLADDPAIQHVMRTHQFTVGILTELTPHEHPELLGLNTNAGQEIKLRVRTNAYDGFRVYSEVRRVLCHELTHNVWGDHDDNFKILNSRLLREVAEFECARSIGTHYLDPNVLDIYEPSSELEAAARAQALGGLDTSSRISAIAALGDDQDDMRMRVLEAATRRMKTKDEDIEDTCGTAGPASISDK